MFKKYKKEKERKIKDLKRRIASTVGYGIIASMAKPKDIEGIDENIHQACRIIRGCNITDIQIVKNNKKQLHFRLVMDKPGLIIGHKGNLITFLEKKYFPEEFKKEIKIFLRESASWRMSLFPMTMEEVEDIMCMN